jgi:3-deoxy-D-manno-octulosonic acid kinase
MRARIPEWMSGEFRAVRSAGSVAIVRNDFAASFETHRLSGCTASLLRAVPSGGGEGKRVPGGRGLVRVVSAGPLGEAVVRPYRRGGLVGKFNERRYFLGNRAFDELVATHRLRLRGAPVPEVLAAVQAELHPGYGGCLVTRRVPRCRPSSVVLRECGAGMETVLEAMGRAVRRFHAAGGIHADLNAHNLLVSEDRDGPVTIVDLDRASVTAGPAPGRRARANLRRLMRSLAKLQLTAALELWEAFERGYEAPPRPPPAA